MRKTRARCARSAVDKPVRASPLVPGSVGVGRGPRCPRLPLLPDEPYRLHRRPSVLAPRRPVARARHRRRRHLLLRDRRVGARELADVEPVDPPPDIEVNGAVVVDALGDGLDPAAQGLAVVLHVLRAAPASARLLRAGGSGLLASSMSVCVPASAAPQADAALLRRSMSVAVGGLVVVLRSTVADAGGAEQGDEQTRPSSDDHRNASLTCNKTLRL